MSVVWKYEIPQPGGMGRAFVDLPWNAEPLSVGLQGDTMVLWALVDIDAAAPEDDMQAEGPRRLIVANTGATVPGFPDGARFLGSLTTDNGIVWHIWDGDAEATA